MIVLRVSDTGAPGFELVVPRDQMPALLDALASVRGRRRGLGDGRRCFASKPAWPVFGSDMDAETIPLEAGIENAGDQLHQRAATSGRK